MNNALVGFEHKICDPSHAAGEAAKLPRPIVFTNGVFDVLHRGHVSCLSEARALGASLVVALNSDGSVKRLGKGSDRPINPLADRLAIVAALESTTLVTWYETDAPLQLILAIRPDVLVKGGDWPVDEIVGAREVRALGGTVHSIPFRFQRSTSNLLERIRQSMPEPEGVSHDERA